MKIIAEIGSNWKVYSDLCMGIEKAKLAGADAVKFQHFTSKELYGTEHPEIDKYALKIQTIEKLKKYADDVGIEFMCSAFSKQGYRRINKLVKTHKIASSEANWIGLVKTVLRFGKPTIISTGGVNALGLRNIVKAGLWRDITLLYCDPSYPSHKSEMAIRNGLLDLIFLGTDIGLSDHRSSATMPPEILIDCSVVEKHYNPFDLVGTPDAGHSLNHEEFTEFVTNCREAETSFTYNKHARVKTKQGWYRPYFGE